MKREAILGVILAGGHSRRFGTDKAVTPLGKLRLIEHVLARARPQVGAMAVSGRDYDLGVPVIPDRVASEGPLSGILSALSWARRNGFSAVASFSCDAPFFPDYLVDRLGEQAGRERTCAYVRGKSGRHPVFAVWHVDVLERLTGFYVDGVRALKVAQDRLHGTPVIFPEGPAPGGDMFFNINRQDDRVIADLWLTDRGRRQHG